MVKCLQQLDLRTTPICLEEQRDDRPLGIKLVDYLTWGPLTQEWKQITVQLPSPLITNSRQPLTFCLKAQ